MTRTGERPRAANGRFVKRSASSDTNRGASQLVQLSVGIFLGILGFVFRPLWVLALVVFGIIWGSLAVERQRQSRTGKSVVAEVVDVVVEQARDVVDTTRTNQAKGDT